MGIDALIDFKGFWLATSDPAALGDELGDLSKSPQLITPASIPIYPNHYILYRPIKNSDEPLI
jgi:hypothetical protein